MKSSRLMNSASMIRCSIALGERIKNERRHVVDSAVGRIAVWNSSELRAGKWRQVNSSERLAPSKTENLVRKGSKTGYSKTRGSW